MGQPAVAPGPDAGVQPTDLDLGSGAGNQKLVQSSVPVLVEASSVAGVASMLAFEGVAAGEALAANFGRVTLAARFGPRRSACAGAQ